MAGERGDPPGAGGDRFLADDLEQAHLADIVQVRAAAKLAREVAHPDDADDVGVFLAEERHRARASSPRRSACGSTRPARARHDQLIDGLFDRVGAVRGRRPRGWRSQTAGGRAQPCCRPAGRACPGACAGHGAGRGSPSGRRRIASRRAASTVGRGLGVER